MANTTVNVDIQVQSKTLGQLEDQLTDINDELRKVEVGSDAFKSLTKEAQALTREVDKVNEEIQGFTFDQKIQAADGAVKLFAGSLSSVVGTLGVLGVESEAFGEFEKKAASAIAVGIGFKDISEGIQQLGPALAKGGTAFLKFAKTTRGALIATGVGAFVVAITAVALNWDKVTKAVEKAGQAFPLVGIAIDGIKKAFNALFDAARPILEFLGILPDEAERAQMEVTKQTESNVKDLERQISIAQAQGEEAKKIFDLKKELIEQELLLLKDKEDAEQEYFDKTTELLTLEAAERKRVHDEILLQRQEEMDAMDKVSTVKAQKAATDVEISTVSTDAINKNLEKAVDANTKAVERDLKLDELKKQSKFAMLDAIQSTADQESAIGKAAFIVRQLLLLDELKAEALKTITFSAQVAARSAMAVAEGTAQTAKIGFPQNIPMLIAYGIQAAAIIKSIRDATRSAKSATAGVSGGAAMSGPSVAAPPSISVQQQFQQDLLQDTTPQFNNIQPSVRAYVLSGDVTTAQEADARLSKRRTLTD